MVVDSYTEQLTWYADGDTRSGVFKEAASGRLYKQLVLLQPLSDSQIQKNGGKKKLIADAKSRGWEPCEVRSLIDDHVHQIILTRPSDSLQASFKSCSS